jgi:hypothetical protein
MWAGADNKIQLILWDLLAEGKLIGKWYHLIDESVKGIFCWEDNAITCYRYVLFYLVGTFE